MKNGYISLTEDEAWDKIWREAGLPQVIKEPYAPNYVLIMDQVFKKHLPQNKDLEFIELGCAPGRWSHYFHTEFGYKVSGIDNSASGIELTRRNLELLGVKADLYLGNVLDHKFNKQFDVVFSMGLIEHFDPTDEIVDKHVSLVKKGGVLIIGVSNLKKSIYALLQSFINKDILKEHVPFSKETLFKLLHVSGVKVIFCDYVGVLNFYLLNIPSDKQFLHEIIKYSQTIMDKFLKTLKIKKESRLFSPYIFIIAKKP